MKPPQDLIPAFDKELIRTKKTYLTLSHANSLLVSDGLMTIHERSQQSLKKLLEEGEIPHAYQTTQSPKQWRIPISKENHDGLSKSHNPMDRPIKKENKQTPLSTILVVSLVVLISIIGIVQHRKSSTKIPRASQGWQDPGMYKSESADWPYYGKTTKELIKELSIAYEGHAVTPSTEQSLYNKIGGMSPGDLKGPKYYKYDFLEVPISMTLVSMNGQRYYLSFQRGGIKKGDPRLNLPK